MANHLSQPTSSCELLSNRQAASMLGVEPETLAQWRYLQKFIDRLPYYKVGRKVFYRRSNLVSFLETCRVGGAQTGDIE